MSYTRAKLGWLEKQAGTNHELRALVHICASMLHTDQSRRPTAADVRGWLGKVLTYMDIRINCFDKIPRPLHSQRRPTYNDILMPRRITNLDDDRGIQNSSPVPDLKVTQAIEYSVNHSTTNDNDEAGTQVSDPRFDPRRDASIRFSELLNSSQPSLYLKSVPYDPFFAARPD